MLSLAVFYYGKAKPGIPLRSRQWDFLVGAGDRQQPYLSPARCSTGMFLR